MSSGFARFSIVRSPYPRHSLPLLSRLGDECRVARFFLFSKGLRVWCVTCCGANIMLFKIESIIFSSFFYDVGGMPSAGRVMDETFAQLGSASQTACSRCHRRGPSCRCCKNVSAKKGVCGITHLRVRLGSKGLKTAFFIPECAGLMVMKCYWPCESYLIALPKLLFRATNTIVSPHD